MARLNSGSTSAQNAQSEHPISSPETPVTTPQKALGSPSFVTGIMNSARKLLGYSIIDAAQDELPQENHKQLKGDGLETDYTGDGNSSLSDDDGEAPPDNDADSLHSVEQALKSASFEIRIPQASKGKRKQPGEEIYDIPREEPPRKKLRSQSKIVAKKPITTGRLLRGQASTLEQEETTYNEPPHAHIKRTNAKNLISKPINTNPTTAPRKRGRPKKISKASKVQSDAETHNTGSERDEGFPRGEGDTSDRGLFVSQSSPLETKGQLTAAKSKIGASGSGSVAPQHGGPFLEEISEDETPIVELENADKPNDEREVSEEAREEGTDVAPVLDSRPLIDIKYLENMLDLANSAGVSRTDGEERHLLKKVDKMFQTNEAARMTKALKRLENALEKLPAPTASADEVGSAQSLVDECIASVKEKAQSILDTRFKLADSENITDYHSPKRMKNILRDVYFLIIPHYIEVMIMVAGRYPLDKSMETSNLERFVYLVSTLSTLIERACDLPTRHQPEVIDLDGDYGSKTFKIRQPALRLRPRLLRMKRLLDLELEEREHAEGLAQDEERRLAAEQKQRERDQREAIEHRKRVLENRRRIREAYENLPIFSDPAYGPILKRDLQEDEEKRRRAGHPVYSQRQSSAITSRKQNGYHGSDQSDVDLDEDSENNFSSEERVRGVFPSDNKHDHSRPWTDIEKAAFIELMQEHTGEDRYSRIAEALQRSMDDIFSWAKEVQEAFDDAHEKGKLTERSDLWTYDVWVPPTQL